MHAYCNPVGRFTADTEWWPTLGTWPRSRLQGAGVLLFMNERGSTFEYTQLLCLVAYPIVCLAPRFNWGHTFIRMVVDDGFSSGREFQWSKVAHQVTWWPSEDAGDWFMQRIDRARRKAEQGWKRAPGPRLEESPDDHTQLTTRDSLRISEHLWVESRNRGSRSVSVSPGEREQASRRPGATLRTATRGLHGGPGLRAWAFVHWQLASQGSRRLLGAGWGYAFGLRLIEWWKVRVQCRRITISTIAATLYCSSPPPGTWLLEDRSGMCARCSCDDTCCRLWTWPNVGSASSFD